MLARVICKDMFKQVFKDMFQSGFSVDIRYRSVKRQESDVGNLLAHCCSKVLNHSL